MVILPKPMNRNPHQSPEEADPVWDLLDQAPAPEASPRFVADTLRAARISASRPPWWRRILSPAPATGLAAATAAVVTMVILLQSGGDPAGSSVVRYDSTQAETIQEVVETEILLAAADDLSEFSDQELVALIGF